MKKTYFKHRFINFKFPLKSAFNIPISIISYDMEIHQRTWTDRNPVTKNGSNHFECR